MYVALDHPHCIYVCDFGETRECPFFAIESFRGEPLTTLHGKPLPMTLHAIFQIFQAASAQDYVHAQGIVQRDIKPSNPSARDDMA